MYTHGHGLGQCSASSLGGNGRGSSPAQNASVQHQMTLHKVGEQLRHHLSPQFSSHGSSARTQLSSKPCSGGGGGGGHVLTPQIPQDDSFLVQISSSGTGDSNVLNSLRSLAAAHQQPRLLHSTNTLCPGGMVAPSLGVNPFGGNLLLGSTNYLEQGRPLHKSQALSMTLGNPGRPKRAFVLEDAGGCGNSGKILKVVDDLRNFMELSERPSQQSLAAGFSVDQQQQPEPPHILIGGQPFYLVPTSSLQGSSEMLPGDHRHQPHNPFPRWPLAAPLGDTYNYPQMPIYEEIDSQQSAAGRVYGSGLPGAAAGVGLLNGRGLGHGTSTSDFEYYCINPGPTSTSEPLRGFVNYNGVMVPVLSVACEGPGDVIGPGQQGGSRGSCLGPGGGGGGQSRPISSSTSNSQNTNTSELSSNSSSNDSSNGASASSSSSSSSNNGRQCQEASSDGATTSGTTPTVVSSKGLVMAAAAINATTTTTTTTNNASSIADTSFSSDYVNSTNSERSLPEPTSISCTSKQPDLDDNHHHNHHQQQQQQPKYPPRLADGYERSRSPQSIYSAKLALKNQRASPSNSSSSTSGASSGGKCSSGSPSSSVYYYSDTLRKGLSGKGPQEVKAPPASAGRPAGRVVMAPGEAMTPHKMSKVFSSKQQRLSAGSSSGSGSAAASTSSASASSSPRYINQQLTLTSDESDSGIGGKFDLSSAVSSPAAASSKKTKKKKDPVPGPKDCCRTEVLGAEGDGETTSAPAVKVNTKVVLGNSQVSLRQSALV